MLPGHQPIFTQPQIVTTNGQIVTPNGQIVQSGAPQVVYIQPNGDTH